MPIYEFYCEPCNTIFNFFARRINTTTSPNCPRCNAPLKRRMSMFACIAKTEAGEPAEEMAIDEAKLTAAMGKLAAEADSLNEDDPRQAVDLMRKFSDMTGVKLGDGMQEALRRMEAGEDPDSIEEDMGAILEHEEPFKPDSGGKNRHHRVKRDETLYEL